MPLDGGEITVSENPSETYISEACFQCLCETVSECKPAICIDVPCGLYKISKRYWLDAGAPTLEGVVQMQDGNSNDGDILNSQKTNYMSFNPSRILAMHQ